MTDREKMIALVAAFLGGLSVTDITPPYGDENLADHLLANGVVVREKGEWEVGDYYDCGDVCSCCVWDSALVPCEYNFCPDCGADMRKGENDNA